MKVYGSPQIHKGSKCYYNNNTICYVCGTGLIFYNQISGKQRYYQLCDKPLNFVCSNGDQVVVASSNSFSVIQFNEVIEITNKIEQQTDFSITSLTCSGSNDLFVTTCSLDTVNLYLYSNNTITQVSSTNAVLPTTAITTFFENELVLIIGLQSGQVLMQTPVKQYSAQSKRQHGAVTGLSVSRNNLLVTRLYGQPVMYQISSDGIRPLKLCREFFAQNQVALLTNNIGITGGQNKILSILNHSGDEMMELGRDYEGGRGILDVIASDDIVSSDGKMAGSITLAVQMEDGHLISVESADCQRWQRSVRQLTGLPHGQCRFRLLQHCSQLIVARGQQIIALNNELDNVEIIEETGSEIYCLSQVSETKLAFAGDENLVRIVEAPLWFLQFVSGDEPLANTKLPSCCPLSMKVVTEVNQRLQTDNYPLWGKTARLDPTVAPVFKINPTKPQQDTSTVFQNQFHTSSAWPECAQLVGVGGSKCFKMVIHGDEMWTLGAGRFDEPSIIAFKAGKQIIKVRGVFDDFCISNNVILTCNRTHTYVYGRDSTLVLKQEGGAKFICAVGERVFMASGIRITTATLINEKLEIISVSDEATEITTLKEDNGQILVGYENGDFGILGNIKIKAAASGAIIDICLFQQGIAAINEYGLVQYAQ